MLQIIGSFKATLFQGLSSPHISRHVMLLQIRSFYLQEIHFKPIVDALIGINLLIFVYLPSELCICHQVYFQFSGKLEFCWDSGKIPNAIGMGAWREAYLWESL